MEDHRIADGVHDGSAFAFAADQPCIMQDLKVFGDVRLIAFEDADQFANGLFSRFELLQNPQSIRFAESSKPARYEVDHFVAHFHGCRGHCLTVCTYAHIVKCMNTIIDVRDYPEFAAGHIEGSKLVPLVQLTATCRTWERCAPITVVCKSGIRSELARQQLSDMGFTAVDVIQGGVDQWKAEGKPLNVLARQPWSMERQVRTTAGGLVLTTMALAYLVSPKFMVGTALIGAGLVVAGVTNTCMMASVLGGLPWNRPAASG